MRFTAKMARANSIGGLVIPFDYCQLAIPALNDKPMSRILGYRPANFAAVFPDGCHNWFYFKLPDLAITETIDEMIIYHSDGLHVSINDRRTNETESAMLEVLAECIGFG